jgi:type II secretory pathway pseudopilin PulG
MTLVELLVVIFIILLVAAIMVPRLQPIMDHARIREAARSIQLYLSSARNQAIASGRSCGVLIEPLPADNGCSMTLKQVETPAYYGGDNIGSTVVSVSGNFSGNSFPNSVGPYLIVALQFQPNVWPSVPLYQGDQIQVGYQGYWFTVAPANSSVIWQGSNVALNKFNSSSAAQPSFVGSAFPCLFAYLDVSHGEQPNLSTPGTSGAYKIRRWPTKSATADMQLPSPTVIDLTWSGNDPVNSSASPTWPISPANNPPIIMFAPDGSVDRTYLQTGGVYQAAAPTTPIYLLVGMRNKVFDNPSGNINTNLNDFNSLWVAIDAATGLIVVTDPAAVGTTTAVLPTPPAASNTPDSRAFARQQLVNLGGK